MSSRFEILKNSAASLVSVPASSSAPHVNVIFTSEMEYTRSFAAVNCNRTNIKFQVFGGEG